MRKGGGNRTIIKSITCQLAQSPLGQSMIESLFRIKSRVLFVVNLSTGAIVQIGVPLFDDVK
jgi:hypothetical protein